MDKLNRRILQELKADGRVSNAELASRVNLSPSACLRRVQELERSGVITGYRAILNPAAFDIGFIAYVTVGLSDHSTRAQEAFETAISQSAQVTECHNIAGAFEYLLRVETQDLIAYKAFHHDILGGLPQVNAITTFVVMGSPKDDRA